MFSLFSFTFLATNKNSVYHSQVCKCNYKATPSSVTESKKPSKGDKTMKSFKWKAKSERNLLVKVIRL
jgi:C4-type Zn-finger protein